ncbi:dermatopontin-like [Crassostrea angulata]|uniref:dermatopontin-like n=1 Tax=Magallana angulata TaxID=2784310 RepID=UPI0022B19383|nr:dermatopontin-like [Crassostrea angulata]
MTSLVSVCLVVVISVAVSECLEWNNNFHYVQNFHCPSDLSFISHFESEFNDWYDDRRFRFACKNVPALSGSVNCRWSGYLNNLHRPVDYICPNQGYINGMYSNYYSWFYDRTFKFRCCSPPAGLKLQNCYWTSYLNNPMGYINYKIPDGYVIRGVNSNFQDYYDDRKIKFQICQSV